MPRPADPDWNVLVKSGMGRRKAINLLDYFCRRQSFFKLHTEIQNVKMGKFDSEPKVKEAMSRNIKEKSLKKCQTLYEMYWTGLLHIEINQTLQPS